MNNKEKNLKMQKIIDKGIVLGLENMKKLCHCLEISFDKILVIHIAGTNGKGSTGLFLQSILTHSGLKTARYSSPAVENPLEIIQIDNNPISEKDYNNLIDKVLEISEKSSIFPTEFEVQTTAAFLYFIQNNVDAAIIECGMGGLTDATNVIENTDISVITSISSDHTQFLGNTLEEIAVQKCGIIKKNSFVLAGVGCDKVLNVIEQKSIEKSADFRYINKNDINLKSTDLSHITFDYKNFKDINLRLLGTFQPENASLAIETALVIRDNFNLKISNENIIDGLNISPYFGRFSIIMNNPLIIVDGAHNIGAWEKLSKTISKFLKNKKISLIMGAFKDKAYSEATELILPFADKIYTVSTSGKRELSSKELSEAILSKGYKSTACPDVLYAAMHSVADMNDAVLAFGSLSYLSLFRDAVNELFYGDMKRIGMILTNETFKKNLKSIEKHEENRIFCKHDFSHLITVAYICIRLSTKYCLNVEKEIIFATSLLHDIGRAAQYETKIPHETAGLALIEEILIQCQFSEKEISFIKDTVSNHRINSISLNNTEKIESLSDIFYIADKLSRDCRNCKAYDECYWSEEEKNHTHEYLY
jgi:dihydrofolate synthase/folylpolyglutamate synthase